MEQLLSARDVSFFLYEWLQVQDLCQQERYQHHDREIFETVVDTARRVAREKFLPCAEKLDIEEPFVRHQKVVLPPETKEAISSFIDAGFLAASFEEQHGGAQLPYTISQVCAAMFYGANISAVSYALLTMGAANLLKELASDTQRQRYMAPMLEGRFFGTMCLSEPQAGSSLSDITTRATPIGDGTFHIQGSKMWISGGEHEMSENIIHLVLAKLPDAPPGVKGISLFIVPRYRLRPDGSPGEDNDVRLVGLNHKMGYRGTVNCALNFGEQNKCVGELVGEPHTGLALMFHMMNEARIAVGLGAAMCGYSGYHYSLDYARERKQGRLPENRDPLQPPVALIEHADIKRMLLAQKSLSEGALALGFYCALLVDQAATATDDTQRKELQLLLDLLTPVAKAWPSEFCLDANRMAIQILGGYGYSREYPLERIYRDNRLNPIHEGANGIQAIDLLGRKVIMKQGAALRLLQKRVTATIEAANLHARTQEFAQQLQQTLDLVVATTMSLATTAMGGKYNLYLANATVYANMFGHFVIAWLWLEQAVLAAQALDAQPEQTSAQFYEGKLWACRYFFVWELPRTKHWATLLQNLEDTCLSMPENSF